MGKKFWKFRNGADGEGAELLLYGDIADSSWWGDEVTPKQFAEDLDGLGAVSSITVRINSGGGDVFAAHAIGNLLEANHAETVARIDGLCASAATIVACHCDRVVAARDSTYMIHPVKMGLFGYADAEVLKQYLDALDKIRDNIVSLYARKTGREKDEVAAQMDATTWMTGEEAMENGFVDELADDGGETVVEDRGGLLFVNGVGTHLAVRDAPKRIQDTLRRGSFGNMPAVPENIRTSNHKEGKAMEIKNVDDLRREFPELVAAVESAASEKAAADERKRIRDIEEMTVRGSEELAAEAKFEKPVSAADFAIRAAKDAKAAEDAKRQQFLDDDRRDAERSGMGNVKPDAPNDASNDEFMNALKGMKK